MDMEYIAHTPKENSRKYFHKLKYHLLKTGMRAAKLGRDNDEKKVLFIAGVLHDLGKYKKEFQEYLRAEYIRKGSGRKSPHAIYGAIAALRFGLDEISYAILGHHAGMYDKKDWQNKCKDLLNSEPDEWKRLFEILQGECKVLDIKTFAKNWKEQLIFKKLKEDKLFKDLYIRFIFSCLTDADFIDSESYFNKQQSLNRKSIALGQDSFNSVKKNQTTFIDYDILLNKLRIYISDKFKLANSPLNQQRSKLKDYALSHSNKPVGFYSLNLLTGMGKTITSIHWAIEHAKTHKLKRIIVVLPFLSIIDQTAKIFKEIFGRDFVLEHHSNFQFKEDENDENNYSYLKLATENWDFPIIVTTNVQFLESIFSNKSSKLRKLHNICNSIVIFDEVQTFPKNMILPTLTMLKNVSEFLNTSFLFCTATQPAFETRRGFIGIDSIYSLVKNPKKLFEDTVRVNYHFYNELEPITMDTLIDSITSNLRSTLVVFNSKPDTLNFYNSVGNIFDVKYHLSTYMCPVHRKIMIWFIKRNLRENKKLLVSSTQLIEAGVDLDFPIVYRAIAPLDSIIQSAGRCNREGKLIDEKGEVINGDVYIFNLENMKMPADKIYKDSTCFTKTFLQNPDMLKSYDIYLRYYDALLRHWVDGDSFNINDGRENLEFKQVADNYRIIEDGLTKSIFIKDFNKKSKNIYNKILNKPYLSKDDYREIQMYSVQVYHRDFDLLKSNFAIEPNEEKGLFLLKEEWYDMEFGIDINKIPMV
ncbi:MAG: CRISPR-associated helicase Cas3' [Leptospiraceae bacterium]|nr:CRISPR-associated helicase Cas3' [Leptospiraceae bacterium]